MVPAKVPCGGADPSANALGISVRTVEVHHARVFDKMNPKSAVGLANRLRAHGAG